MTTDQDSGYVAVAGAPLYRINRQGVVKNELGVVLRHQEVNGYAALVLSVEDGTRKAKKTFYVHRMLAEAFIPKPVGATGRLTVGMKNFIKLDHRLSNLRWLTVEQAKKRRGGR